MTQRLACRFGACLVVLAGLTVLGPATLRAQEETVEAPAALEPFVYEEPRDPVMKFGRGATNVLSGWLELPKQVHLGLQENNPVAGVSWGVVKGAGLTVVRIGVGLYELVTFPIPVPRGYASPYPGMELPDYAWE